MSATIHYLRPFEREDLTQTQPEPAEDAQAAEEDAPHAEKKPARRRAMPCGRKSRFKKRMDGTVVPRDKR